MTVTCVKPAIRDQRILDLEIACLNQEWQRAATLAAKIRPENLTAEELSLLTAIKRRTVERFAARLGMQVTGTCTLTPAMK